MATGSGAFPLKAGYNQSGGGYYINLEQGNNLVLKLRTYSGSTGSGGAATVGNFTGATLPTAQSAGVSTMFASGCLVKDMGRTIVSAGRTFRKIQGIVPTASQSSPSFGVGGGPAGAVDPGYLTYYVEIGREGAGADAGTGAENIALLARYF